MKDWYVYILECSDGTFYTGVTDDIYKRLSAHNSGKGAKYTSGRAPQIIKYSEKVNGRSAAQIREAEIKKMTRQAKEKLFC